MSKSSCGAATSSVANVNTSSCGSSGLRLNTTSVLSVAVESFDSLRSHSIALIFDAPECSLRPLAMPFSHAEAMGVMSVEGYRSSSVRNVALNSSGLFSVTYANACRNMNLGIILLSG